MDFSKKSSVAEIRSRFDDDVERFSNLETGQTATIDAAVSMELIARAASRVTPHLRSVLDIGCGAGNNTLKLLEIHGELDATLLDLSAPMLERARQRVRAASHGAIETVHGDFRDVALADEAFDVVLAAAVFHHLRDTDDWRRAFEKVFRVLRPGGSVWITDLVHHEHEAVQAMMWARYGDYLTARKDDAYRDAVFAYIAKEDSPRPLTFQLDLLRDVGFSHVDVLHKKGCFAAFGAVKPD